MPRLTLVTDMLDLVLARCCLGCERPGRALCDGCLATLRAGAGVVAAPGGLPTVSAATAYDGLGRRLILDYKERGNRALAPMLGELLAEAVRVQASLLSVRACTLVPVPSHRHPVRGFDALGVVARAASRSLAADGLQATLAHPVAAAARYRPLKGLTRSDRLDQVSGAFRAAPRTGRVRAPVIVVDDVITSGATVAEVVRTLAGMRIQVAGVATVACTSRGRSATSLAPARPRTPP